MWTEFYTYLKVGLHHILDPQGIDHILFILVFSCVYKLNETKKLIISITAFTVGHSITLALAALQLLQFNSALIEWLILATIGATAILNLVQKPDRYRPARAAKPKYFRYLLIMFFGLIHGMGFSNLLTALQPDVSKVVVPLLSFNVGIEIGQLIIMAALMLLNIFVLEPLRTKQRDRIMSVSMFTLGATVILLLQRLE